MTPPAKAVKSYFSSQGDIRLGTPRRQRPRFRFLEIARKWLDDMSLNVKLTLAPALGLLLLVLLACSAIWGSQLQRKALTELHQIQLPSYTFAAGFESDLRDVNGLISRSLGYEAMGYSAKEVALIDASLAAKVAELKEALAERSAAETSEAGRQQLNAMTAMLRRYEKAVADTLDMKVSGPAIASTFLSTAQKLYEDLLKETTDISQARLAEAGEGVAGAVAAAKRAETAIIAAAVAATFTGILLSLFIACGLLRRVAGASASIAALAAGDLTQALHSDGRDEIGRLAADIEAVREHLSNSISAVRLASESVRVAAGNADLSQRTEQQASSLLQTASSMEQINSTVRNSADTARQAKRLAASASAAAEQGGVVVGRVVSTMNDISVSSKRISDISGAIDGIAFQTNILALNAAAEAARAGAQGRGFAVVAAEVPSLAQRSAGAARQIKSPIGASVERVEAGSRLVQDAGMTMNYMVVQVKRVSDLIGEITVSTQEQTSGIGQVSQAVMHLDQVTRQNAALVEQSAAAAESLSQQAVRLVESVCVFQIDRHRAAAAALPAHWTVRRAAACRPLARLPRPRFLPLSQPPVQGPYR